MKVTGAIGRPLHFPGIASKANILNNLRKTAKRLVQTCVKRMRLRSR